MRNRERSRQRRTGEEHGVNDFPKRQDCREVRKVSCIRQGDVNSDIGPARSLELYFPHLFYSSSFPSLFFAPQKRNPQNIRSFCSPCLFVFALPTRALNPMSAFCLPYVSSFPIPAKAFASRTRLNPVPAALSPLFIFVTFFLASFSSFFYPCLFFFAPRTPPPPVNHVPASSLPSPSYFSIIYLSVDFVFG